MGTNTRRATGLAALVLAGALALLPGAQLAGAQDAPGQVEMTFLGNMTFRFVSPVGKVIYTNPYFTGNVDAPIAAADVDRADILLVGSAHADDGGGPDTAQIAIATGATIILDSDNAPSMREAGVPASQVPSMATGGNTNRLGPNASSLFGDLWIKMVPAIHGGNAVGYVIGFENGLVVYFASDTSLMADMALFGEVYQPHVAILPIAGLFMMDPEDAAYATKLLMTNNPNLTWVVPAHWRSGGRSPGGGDPEHFVQAVQAMGLAVDVMVPVPGQAVMLSP